MWKFLERSMKQMKHVCRLNDHKLTQNSHRETHKDVGDEKAHKMKTRMQNDTKGLHSLKTTTNTSNGLKGDTKIKQMGAKPPQRHTKEKFNIDQKHISVICRPFFL